ncbi:antibiotic biosynthesis monooxygenase [Gordonia sp. (in: high G+C Gram-positive bacteria)]|uniref:putative quinol monooxygenase n=1 Tax=Gordonia sp. (in: high G+C Gram-positive bacteria) TaxID=84139 RepID=UPI0016B262C6|nr:antibiotic biosynthesis monooxygenase [Gordonia sp. (in: high G+C Gram-positive bacteria)]NLG45247.1 antibiotic biosynthesis monooxygenase [Gordonia sp. (in: high G+C Gram-positive bacteria)]
MIFIVVKFDVRDEYVDRWPAMTAAFTAATRAEPGNLWFDWSRSIENGSEFVLVEAFADSAAGAAHVNAPHFREGLESMRPGLKATPKIISREVEGSGWSEMGELEIA